MVFVFIVIGGSLLFGGKVPTQYVSDGGFFPNGWGAALLVASFGLYSFLGIEMGAVSSGEASSGKAVSKATRTAFAMLAGLYVGGMAVLVGGMPWRHAGDGQSPFVTVFYVAGIPAAGFIMNLVVLSAALSGANATLYVASRMLFSLARSGYAPAKVGVLNAHGVPMRALLLSMIGIVAAIVVELNASDNAFLYIINTSLVGGMLAWLISLAAHIRFRRTISPEQLAALPMRSPLGAVGSWIGFAAVTAAVICTAWVPGPKVAVVRV